MLWSKPVTKRGAGKLLIVGGNSHGFAHVAKTYSQAEIAGAGNIRAIVPDSLAKLTKGLGFIEYAPSNPSGGFAQRALSELLELAEWSDGVLLAGDLGKNSETSLLLENFMDKYSGVLVIDPEALGSLSLNTASLLDSDHRVVIWTRSDLQKAVTNLKLSKAITSESGKAQIAETLHEITSANNANIVVIDGQTVWIAQKSSVISTDAIQNIATAKLAVWTIQNPKKTKETLVCAAWELKNI